ncbi:hypothetical protein [Streptomyces swartbergensis]|uniref:hypothetical protein n=1 Tax=Streptomyces swartbergensis TaxID=487165 RepID=UPI0037F9F994
MPCRRTVLGLVSVLTAEAGRVDGKFLAPARASAWDQAVPEVIALLAAPEAKIRRAAAGILEHRARAAAAGTAARA